MKLTEASERWDGYFYLFLGQGKHPEDAADLADNALYEWRKRHDETLLSEEQDDEIPDLPEDRNVDSSLPPNGSMFYTKMVEEEGPEILSGCCDAPLIEDLNASILNDPVCSKCKKPARA